MGGGLGVGFKALGVGRGVGVKTKSLILHRVSLAACLVASLRDKLETTHQMQTGRKVQTSGQVG